MIIKVKIGLSVLGDSPSVYLSIFSRYSVDPHIDVNRVGLGWELNHPIYTKILNLFQTCSTATPKLIKKKQNYLLTYS